ncbi:MAG TPA: hypothetical protein VIV84_02435 [Burkholderiaceae bacterium]
MSESRFTPLSRAAGTLAALALIAFSGAALSQTKNANERQEGRDVKQDAKQDARQGKQECKQTDGKSNTECRQEKRDTKQDGRQEKRDIKH